MNLENISDLHKSLLEFDEYVSDYLEKYEVNEDMFANVCIKENPEKVFYDCDLNDIRSYNTFNGQRNTDKSIELFSKSYLVETLRNFKLFQLPINEVILFDINLINNFINNGGIIDKRAIWTKMILHVNNLKKLGIQFNTLDSKILYNDNKMCADLHLYIDYLYWKCIRDINENEYVPNNDKIIMMRLSYREQIESGLKTNSTYVDEMEFADVTEQIFKMHPLKVDFYNKKIDKDDGVYKYESKIPSNFYQAHLVNFGHFDPYEDDGYDIDAKLKITHDMHELDVQKLMYPHLQFDEYGYCINPQDDVKPNYDFNRYKFRVCHAISDVEKRQMTFDETYFVTAINSGLIFHKWEKDPYIEIMYNEDIKMDRVIHPNIFKMNLFEIQQYQYPYLKFDPNGFCIDLTALKEPVKNENRYRFRIMDRICSRELEQMNEVELWHYLRYNQVGMKNYNTEFEYYDAKVKTMKELLIIDLKLEYFNQTISDEYRHNEVDIYELDEFDEQSNWIKFRI